MKNSDAVASPSGRTPHREFLRLAKDPVERQSACRALLRSEPDDDVLKEIRAATNGGYTLGGRRFQTQVEAALGWRVTRGKAGRPPAATEAAPEGQADLI